MIDLLKDRSIISLKGEDAHKFLQNLITNDIELIDQKSAFYAFIINPQGRYLCELFIYKVSSEEYLIDYPSSIALEKIFLLYKLKLKVLIEKVEDLALAFSNEKIEKALHNRVDKRFKGETYYRSIVLKDFANFDNESNLYLTEKFNQGIADFHDLEVNKTLLVDFAFERYEAISYTKGCFMGQEVLTRAKFQGVNRKKVIYGTTNLNTLEKGDEIFLQEAKIGKITSVYKNKFIGVIKIDPLTDEFIKEVIIKDAPHKIKY